MKIFVIVLLSEDSDFVKTLDKDDEINITGTIHKGINKSDNLILLVRLEEKDLFWRGNE